LISRDFIFSDMRHLAECVRLGGKLQEAESLYREAINMLDHADARNANQLAKAYFGLAQVLLDAHRLNEGEKAVQTALAKFEQNRGTRSFWYGRCLVTLGRLRSAQGKTAEAAELLEQALHIVEPLVGPHHPIRALTLRRLVNTLKLGKNDKEADAIQSELKEVEHHLRDQDF
ncbi:MAG: tetratricopeptide repeat protein, partial [Terriglobales bacterium]